MPAHPAERHCRFCGCTEHNACVDATGQPCWWVADDICSHCVTASSFLRLNLGLAAQHQVDEVRIPIGIAEQLLKISEGPGGAR